MRLMRKIVLLSYAIVAATVNLSAQAQTGIIYGKVEEGGGSGTPLPGATVLIKGTNLGTSSDVSGIFMFQNAPVGNVVIVVSFIGYATKEVELTVGDKEMAIITISLEGDVTTLQEITVKASLEGQQKALNQQQSADNIKNIVSGDLIGRFPDLNVAEALQRVPGVNISRSRGEGSTISIRGTPAHFTTININGEQIPSTQDNGARNESLDLIAADQLSSMEITKAITPDMDGDAIGGSVNLRTPVAKGTKLSLRAEAGGGYNSLSQGFNGIGRLKADKRFLPTSKLDNGRLGVMLGLSYFGTDNEEDSYGAVWSGSGDTPIQRKGLDSVVIENYNLTDLINQRKRYGATATIDYQFSPGSSIVFNLIYSRRQDHDERNRLFGILNESAGIQWQTLDSLTGAELRRDISVKDYYSENYSYNLQGNHLFKKMNIEWALFHSPSKRFEENIGGRFVRGADSRINLRVNNEGGIYNDFPQFESTSEGLDFYDPFTINAIDRYETNTILLNASNNVAKVNLRLPYKISSAEGFMKGGFKYRQQSNERTQNSVLLNFSDPNQVLNERAAFTSVVGDFEDEDFMDGHIRFGPSIDQSKFNRFFSKNDRLFVRDNIGSSRNSLFGTYSAKETIMSGYLMTRLQWKNWMTIAGLRYEANTVDYNAFEVNNVTGVGTPMSDGTNYAFVLPNVHLRYKLTKLSNMRFAFTQSYSRANFTDVIPFMQIDEAGSNLVAGNPDLRPAFSTNVDLLYEKYLTSIGIISGGVFYKNIDDFQFNRNLPFLRPGDPFYDQFPGYSFRQEQNGENAIVYGFELNVQAPLDFLPGLLNGLGLYANYTFTESDAFTNDRTGINLPGQAKHTWNGALTFDYKKFTIKGSVNYNGTFLAGVAGESNNDIVQLARMQVDVNSSFKISDRFRVFAEFLNITNEPSIRYQGIRERVNRYNYFGWWNRFGLTFNL
jgi:TonB-dependent receptor